MTVAPWAAEQEISTERAQRFIKAQFPNLAGEPLEMLGEGWDNAAFLVGKRYVFRFPRRAISAPLIETEERILPRIAAMLPVAIPIPIFNGQPQDDYPWRFAGYEQLKGHTACSRRLDDKARARLAPQLGTFLRALHSIDVHTAHDANVLPDLIGRLDHASRVPKSIKRFRNLQCDGVIGDITPLLDFLQNIAPADESAPVLVHGDLYARHLLLDQDQNLAGIIDWGDVHVGNPASDLMVAHVMLPPRLHWHFREAYGPIAEGVWHLARTRAIYHTAMVLSYAHAIGDANLLNAGLTSLTFLQEGAPAL